MKWLICSIVLTLAVAVHCQDYQRRVDALERLLQNVQAKTLHHSHAINVLRQQIEAVERSEDNLKNAISAEKRAASDPVVAFMATRQANLSSIPIYHNIVFEKVDVNEQNAYNSNTGVFTCPYNGLYEFATTIVSEGEQHNLNFQMMKETSNIAYVHATLYEYDMGTQVAVTHCNKGEQVWIRQAKHSHFGLPGDFCTFSGHLIHMY